MTTTTTERVNVGPGSLVELTGSGPASLVWKTEPLESDMILLTPGYEQFGTLLGVGGVLVVCWWWCVVRWWLGWVVEGAG